MTDAGFFRGTSSEQDNRFSDKEKKLLKQMKFADNLSTKIEMNKIKVDVLKPWIGKRISELLGMEDDVVADFVVNQLEAEKNPDARKIQINLTGFLNGRNARIFIGELWDMLISAQTSPSGIPAAMVEAKKEEIRKRTEDQERISESLKRTVSRFTEKIKDERDSPPNRRDRSSSRDRDSKRTTKTGDADDASKSQDEPGGPKRNYRSRRSASASPEPNNKRNKSRSRSGSRERRNNRDRPDNRRAPASRPSFDSSRGEGTRDRRGGPDRFNRDRRSRSPRPNRRSRSRSPQQRRPRSRSPPPHRGAGSGGRASSPRAVRRRSPLYESRNNRNDSNYRDAPVTADRDRYRSRHDDRRNSPSKSTDKSGGKDGKEEDDQSHLNKSSKPGKDGGSASASSNDSSSSPENGTSRTKSSKRKSSSADDSEKSDNDEDEDQSKKKDKKDKKKKKEKKHKKHKKHNKKLKKTKDKQKSSSDEEEESDADDVDGKVQQSKGRNAENGSVVVLLPNEKIAQSFRKLVQPEDPSIEDLETKLREKALESMMKANMNR